MDPHAVLEAYDEQIRRVAGGGGAGIERDEHVVRHVGDGWSGVSWSGLDADTADEAIAAQIERFSSVPGEWEWKHYSYDEPADLPRRLLAAGFVAEEPETVLVAEVAALDVDVAPPPGVQVVPVVDEQGIAELVRVHDEVFGGDHSGMGEAVLAALLHEPPEAAAFVAKADGVAICAGRVEFHEGTDFASIWGGGTLPAWRGRGVFRSLVAVRAREAAARGLRYLQVDASTDSRPILTRLGFVELATTTPYVRQGRAEQLDGRRPSL